MTSKVSTRRGNEECGVSTRRKEDVVDEVGLGVEGAAKVDLVSPELEAGGVSLGSLTEDSWTGGGAVSGRVWEDKLEDSLAPVCPGPSGELLGVSGPIPTAAQDPSISTAEWQAQPGP